MIKSYHRARTLQEALALRFRTDQNVAVLYGYDALVDEETETVVDLQALGLHHVQVSGGTAQIESCVSLQQVVDSPDLPEWLRTLAQQEEPSTFRNMRTIGHLLTHPASESMLLAGLIAAQVSVSVQWTGGLITLSIDSFLEGVDGLIVSVTVPLSGRVETACVARTPADKPIVGAVAHQAENDAIALVLCGVAPLPIMTSPMEIDSLTPPDDFRGSAAYRKDMAAVLTHRVLSQMGR